MTLCSVSDRCYSSPLLLWLIRKTSYTASFSISAMAAVGWIHRSILKLLNGLYKSW